MSKNAQQEIASTIECDLANKKETNAIYINTAILACIIVFVTGLTAYISTVSKTAAYIMPVLLLGCAYPVYKLIEQKAEYLPLTLAAGLAYILCLSLMLAFIPPNAFKYVSVFLVCFLLLAAAAVSLITVVNVKKIYARELSAIFSMLFLCGFSVLLLIYFKDSAAKGFGFQLWRGVTFTVAVKNLALTYAGIILFSACTVLFVVYLFTQKMRLTTKYITHVATFAALSVMFKIMGNATTISLAALGPWFKFTLVYIPWVAAGVVVGPAGAIVATGVGDFLGQILLPSGAAWFWLTWISNMLFPLFPALIYKYVKLGKNYDWLKILIGMIISSFVCTLGLGTLALAILYETEYLPLLLERWPQLIVIGVNYGLLVTLLPVLQRAKLPASAMRVRN